jgi:sulfite exporter TauE/SafE
MTSIVMILLGFDLIGIFSGQKCTFPSGIFQFLRKIQYKTLTPLIIGMSTFFLPCGFTQSMQVAALASG